MFDINDIGKAFLTVMNILMMNFAMVVYIPEEISMFNYIRQIYREAELVLFVDTGIFLAYFMISSLVKYFWKVSSSNLYDKYIIQKETDLILDNVGEAVITHSDEGITFVNASGIKVLNLCFSSVDLNEKQILLNELDNIRKYRKQQKFTEKSSKVNEAQNLILNKKSFETYSKEGTIIPDNEKVKYSI